MRAEPTKTYSHSACPRLSLKIPENIGKRLVMGFRNLSPSKPIRLSAVDTDIKKRHSPRSNMLCDWAQCSGGDGSLVALTLDEDGRIWGEHVHSDRSSDCEEAGQGMCMQHHTLLRTAGWWAAA